MSRRLAPGGRRKPVTLAGPLRQTFRPSGSERALARRAAGGPLATGESGATLPSHVSPAEARVQLAVYYPVERAPGPQFGPEFAPARAAREDGEVRTMVYSPKADAVVPQAQKVRRAARAGILNRLSPQLREVAECYAALVERQGAIRISNVEGASGGGGVSDGGAAARCQEAERLRRARSAIGDGLVDLGVPRAGWTVERDIPLLLLVDEVCLADATLEAVLSAHGWVRSRRNVRLCREALESALTAAGPFLS